jgi:hypothetical protein
VKAKKGISPRRKAQGGEEAPSRYRHLPPRLFSMIELCDLCILGDEKFLVFIPRQ